MNETDKRNERRRSQQHGIEMLKKYLDSDATLYGQFCRRGTTGPTAFWQCLVVDHNYNYGNSSIVNVSLYVANAAGLRRDKNGAVAARTFQDIVEAVKLAVKIDRLDFIRL